MRFKFKPFFINNYNSQKRSHLNLRLSDENSNENKYGQVMKRVIFFFGKILWGSNEILLLTVNVLSIIFFGK